MAPGETLQRLEAFLSPYPLARDEVVPLLAEALWHGRYRQRTIIPMPPPCPSSSGTKPSLRSWPWWGRWPSGSPCS